MTPETETTIPDGEFGFTWGATESLWYLLDSDGGLRGVSEDVVTMLRDLATGELSRDELPDNAATVLDRLIEQGYVRQNGPVERVVTPDDIRFWPRAALFLGLASVLVTVAASQIGSLPNSVSALTPFDIVTVVALTIVTILVHEGGHYVASRPYFDPSLQLSTMNGIIPVLTTKTHEAWILPRNVRRWISLAGPFVEVSFILSVVGATVGAAGWTLGLQLYVIGSVFRIAGSLCPLFHGDGYWLFVDTFGLVNVRKRGLEDFRERTISGPSAYIVVSYAFAGILISVSLISMLLRGPVGIAVAAVWGLVVLYAKRDRLPGAQLG